MTIETISHYILVTLSIVLTFGLAVFVHEFGHMFFALIRGVGVESFAIGMGPRMVSWKWHGIDFSLRYFPVGGFVKLSGMMPGEEAAEEGPQSRAFAPEEQTNSIELANDGKPATVPAAEEDKTLSESSYDDMLALANKGLLTKLMVFGGGVFMNYVTAIAAMALLLMLPAKMPLLPFTIWNVQPETAVAAAGFQKGDKVVAVNGQPITYIYDLSQYLEEQAKTDAQDEPGQLALHFTVERNGTPGQTAELAPVDLETFNKALDEDQLEMVNPPLIRQVFLSQPADKAGLKAGDRIVAVNGTPISTFNEMAKIVSASVDKEVSLTYERDGEQTTVTLTPNADYKKHNEGRIGVVAGVEKTITVPGKGLFTAASLAPIATWQMLVKIIVLHRDFFKTATLKQVGEGMGGPVMIARATAQASSLGFDRGLEWFIQLNLLLMIFNLLPLPVLDGGFILVSLIESVIRRPIPARVLAPIYTGFVIFFITLMVVISLWDVKRWIM